MLRLIVCGFYSVMVMVILTTTPIAMAHHTWAVDYYTDSETEIEGIVSDLRWTNPHTKFQVIVNAGTDTEQVWEIYSSSVSNLSRMNVTGDILKVGDRVRMAGFPARHNEHGMYMSHLLLPDGREAIFTGGGAPRWADETFSDNETIRSTVVEESIDQRPDSIFAVWSVVSGLDASRTLHPRSTEDYPLSAEALQKIAEFDPEADSPFGNCAPKGGSITVDAPYPMQLIDQGDMVLQKMEEYDLTREIHISEIHDDRGVEPSLLGYSTGRWQGDTLVVTTTKIDYPFLNVGSVPDFIPQSAYAQTLETFKLDEDRSKLHYSLVVVDTEMLTRPMSLGRYYIWRSGEEVQPYLCDES